MVAHLISVLMCISFGAFFSCMSSTNIFSLKEGEDGIVEPILHLHAFAYHVCNQLIFAPLPNWCSKEIEALAKEKLHQDLRQPDNKKP